MDFSFYGNKTPSDLVSKSASANYYQEILPNQQHTLNADAPVFNGIYNNLMRGKCTINDVMDDFKRNGIDSDYDPEENIWTPNPTKTIPETVSAASKLTEEQLRVLSSLPDTFILELLKFLNPAGAHLFKHAYPPVECRFCKNNGERESFYRSHNLKDLEGRVLCPVLRAFVCRRCGASGDNAHTIKYCPRSTDEERIKSSAMLRTVRMASGRRRLHSGPREQNSFFNSGNMPASQAADIYNAYQTAPLEPHWAALEQKLLLY